MFEAAGGDLQSPPLAPPIFDFDSGFATHTIDLELAWITNPMFEQRGLHPRSAIIIGIIGTPPAPRIVEQMLKSGVRLLKTINSSNGINAVAIQINHISDNSKK